MASIALDDVAAVTGEYVALDGESYYRITNSHLMDDFFMSLVGADDHWMFISSNGALTTGRRNPDTALFPYASDDQISAARAISGSYTLVRVQSGEHTLDGPKLWQPFAPHSSAAWQIRRSLYKTPLGNKLVLEEINDSLRLRFRYRWVFSQRFGFVRSCHLENFGEETRSLELLDGLRNILPYGVGSEFLMRFSNLANAYKKSELIAGSNIGVFYLSSIPTDRTEPSEGLKATVAWQFGLTPNATMLSSEQIAAFESGESPSTETELRGKAGAYLTSQSVELQPEGALNWSMVAELAQDHAQIVALDEWLQKSKDPGKEVADDIIESEQQLLRIVSSSDGVQCGANERRANRHLSNTVFNVMRGGVPLKNYRVPLDDFCQHISKANREVYARHKSFLTSLPDSLDVQDLRDQISARNDADFTRLGLEYLPLAFSRRHGDPTRPWNRFSIDLRSESGDTSLNYQGNWRDIFQNWEAMGVAFPEFMTAMICRFVNATTADGYNPYRLTKDGFEWEEPTPDDPWANIGYWGDHQIIYLLKLLEWTKQFQAEKLDGLLDADLFTHANVPYRIKDYEQICKNVRDTIVFDADESRAIRERVEAVGNDGKLLRNGKDEIHRVSLVEKLLTLSLAKMSNFVPDGGMWLNTQRPEWNDANNALVGNGLSMVTACYLHRWFGFLHGWFSTRTDESFSISEEVASFAQKIAAILSSHEDALSGELDAARRLQIVEALSSAGSEYRNGLYESGMSGETTAISRQDCLNLFETARKHLEVTIRNNRRSDGLYHAYNLLKWTDGGLEVDTLYEMLEGQVAVLSAGLLTAEESITVLNALRESALYRENQDSYLLYPDRNLPRFLEKNCVDDAFADSNPLLLKLLADGNERIVNRDVRGVVHFDGRFRNAADLQAALDELGDEYSEVIQDGGAELTQKFNDIFGHRKFTGRSGTFFAYEGLGSIYWHMVSKLVLAVSENYFAAIDTGESPEVVSALRDHFRAIRRGVGAEKQPAQYGAFPSDPYSHTPENAGVKQPGMTGQVKEDILSRFAEIGVHIEDGCIRFRLEMFDRGELLSEPKELKYFDVAETSQTISIPKNGFGFTLCQVPIVYEPGDADVIRVVNSDGKEVTIEGTSIDAPTSQRIFARSGEIVRVECQFKALSG